jgi:hypothetical protein
MRPPSPTMPSPARLFDFIPVPQDSKRTPELAGRHSRTTTRNANAGLQGGPHSTTTQLSRTSASLGIIGVPAIATWPMAGICMAVTAKVRFQPLGGGATRRTPATSFVVKSSARSLSLMDWPATTLSALPSDQERPCTFRTADCGGDHDCARPGERPVRATARLIGTTSAQVR